MSVARVHYVKHARQLYARDAKLDEEGRPVAVPVTSKRTGEQKVGRGGRPMTRRVRVADKSRPLPMPKCGKCGKQINVGDPYRYFIVGFRSSYKRVRCMDSACTPKDSERESSGPRSEILSAIETANGNLDGYTAEGTSDASEVEQTVQEVAEAFTSAAEQWREADEQFGGGGNTENGERADTAESSASELESWSTSNDQEPDFSECEDDVHKDPSEREDEDDDREKLDPGDTECDSCVKIRDDWFEALIDEAREAIDGVEIP